MIEDAKVLAYASNDLRLIQIMHQKKAILRENQNAIEIKSEYLPIIKIKKSKGQLPLKNRYIVKRKLFFKKIIKIHQE